MPIVVAVVVAVVMIFAVSYLKRRRYSEMVNCVEERNFAKFDQLVSDRWTKLLLPKFSLLDMKLNAAILEGNEKKATSYFDEIIHLPLTPKMKEQYYMKGFNFYVAQENKKKARQYLDLVEGLGNERMLTEAKRVYNIYILKNDKDLNALLKELEDLPEEGRGVNEYLISLIYKNKKDLENAKKYEALSEKHFAMVDALTEQSMNA
jgi:hypothetical protein